MSEILELFKQPFRLAAEDHPTYWWARRFAYMEDDGPITQVFSLDELDFPWEIDVETGDLSAMVVV